MRAGELSYTVLIVALIAAKSLVRESLGGILLYKLLELGAHTVLQVAKQMDIELYTARSPDFDVTKVEPRFVVTVGIPVTETITTPTPNQNKADRSTLYLSSIHNLLRGKT